MLVPCVDEHIWSKLSVRSKKQDLSVMKLQGLLLQVQSAIINTVEKMCSNNFDQKESIKDLIDSSAVLSHVNKQLSSKRRDAFRPLLNNNFKDACSHSNKIGKTLFGEDINKTIQNIASTNKVMTNKLYKPKHNEYHKGSNSHGFSYRKSNFLSNRGRAAYPLRNNQTYARNQSQNQGQAHTQSYRKKYFKN